jgi:hypothetical protein
MNDNYKTDEDGQLIAYKRTRVFHMRVTDGELKQIQDNGGAKWVRNLIRGARFRADFYAKPGRIEP